MLAELFYKLREFQVPVSVTEYLTLLSAMEKGISGLNIDSFYFLARSTLVTVSYTHLTLPTICSV